MKNLILYLFLTLMVTTAGYSRDNDGCDRLECLEVYDQCLAAGNSGFVCYSLFLSCARGEIGC
ncbi:hypothetical protein [Marinicella sp. W31]|uniref:hypothetical protein n=1 Tax=Marinicella sp. W31 TaxID=3023713 RepID=UPI00375692ED